MSNNKWTDFANKAIARDGYLAITSVEQYAPGTVLWDIVIEGELTAHPFVVIGPATAEEYLGQCEFLWGDRVALCECNPHFHKVTTD